MNKQPGRQGEGEITAAEQNKEKQQQQKIMSV